MSDVRTSAIRDWRRFSASSMDLLLTFIAPTGETAQVKGIGTNNAITFETDGQEAIGKSMHIGFSEAALLASNSTYPTRNDDDEVDIDAHRVSFIDARGKERFYAVKNHYPDETVGMIMCDLERFKP